MKTQEGEVIEMAWDDKELFVLVRGWVGESATRKACNAYAGNTWGYKGWAFKECYAANLQTDLSRSNGWASEIRLFDAPGKGRYKVSVLIPPNAPHHPSGCSGAKPR